MDMYYQWHSQALSQGGHGVWARKYPSRIQRRSPGGGMAPRSQIYTNNLQLSNAFLCRFVAESVLLHLPYPSQKTLWICMNPMPTRCYTTVYYTYKKADKWRKLTSCSLSTLLNAGCCALLGTTDQSDTAAAGWEAVTAATDWTGSGAAAAATAGDGKDKLTAGCDGGTCNPWTSQQKHWQMPQQLLNHFLKMLCAVKSAYKHSENWHHDIWIIQTLMDRNWSHRTCWNGNNMIKAEMLSSRLNLGLKAVEDDLLEALLFQCLALVLLLVVLLLLGLDNIVLITSQD